MQESTPRFNLGYLTGTPLDLVACNTVTAGDRLSPRGAIGKNTMVTGRANSGKSLVSNFFQECVLTTPHMSNCLILATEDSLTPVMRARAAYTYTNSATVSRTLANLLIDNVKGMIEVSPEFHGIEGAILSEPTGLAVIDSVSEMFPVPVREVCMLDSVAENEVGSDKIGFMGDNTAHMRRGVENGKLLEGMAFAEELASIFTVHLIDCMYMCEFSEKHNTRDVARGTPTKAMYLTDVTWDCLKAQVIGDSRVQVQLALVRSSNGPIVDCAFPLTFDMSNAIPTATLSNWNYLRHRSKDARELVFDAIYSGALGCAVEEKDLCDLTVQKAMYIEACTYFLADNPELAQKACIRMPDDIEDFLSWCKWYGIEEFEITTGRYTGEGTILNMLNEYHRYNAQSK